MGHGLASVEADEAALAWRGALVGAALVAVTQPVFVASGVSLFGWTAVPRLRLGHVALALVIAVVLVLRGPTRSVRLPVIAYWALLLPLVPLFWLAEAEMEASSLTWSPFLGHKLVMLGVAVLAGGPPVHALLLIATFALLAVLQVSSLTTATWAGEPTTTLVYAGVAVVLVFARAGHHRLLRAHVHARAEARARERLARLLLALRDMGNSPLQALELELALLERGAPLTPDALARMRAALVRMLEASRLLGRSEQLVQWGRGEASFDPEEVLSWLEAVEAPLHRLRGDRPPEGG